MSSRSAPLPETAQALHLVVILLDRNLRITHINAAAREILGVDGAAVGTTVADLTARSAPAMREFADTVHRFVSDAVSSGQTIRHQEMRLPDGTVVETSYQAVTVDDAIGHLLVGHDVTDRALIRRALEERNLELETLAEMKTSFLATISHELRTPLTAITSLLDLIPDGGAGPDINELLDAVRRNTECLRGIVDDLLIMARIESRSQDLEPATIDVTDLIRRAAPESVRFAGRAGPAFVRGDRRWLSRMFTRLFAAAASTAEAGTTLSVHVGVVGRRWTAIVSGAASAPEAPNMPVGLDLAVATTIAGRHGGQVTGGQGHVLVSVSLPVLLPTGT